MDRRRARAQRGGGSEHARMVIRARLDGTVVGSWAALAGSRVLVVVLARAAAASLMFAVTPVIEV